MSQLGDTLTGADKTDADSISLRLQNWCATYKDLLVFITNFYDDVLPDQSALHSEERGNGADDDGAGSRRHSRSAARRRRDSALGGIVFVVVRGGAGRGRSRGHGREHVVDGLLAATRGGALAGRAAAGDERGVARLLGRVVRVTEPFGDERRSGCGRPRAARVAHLLSVREAVAVRVSLAQRRVPCVARGLERLAEHAHTPRAGGVQVADVVIVRDVAAVRQQLDVLAIRVGLRERRRAERYKRSKDHRAVHLGDWCGGGWFELRRGAANARMANGNDQRSWASHHSGSSRRLRDVKSDAS